MSSCDDLLSTSISPVFKPTLESVEPRHVQDVINHLGLQKHPEGGYYTETDRDSRRVPNPFRTDGVAGSGQPGREDDDATRSASTSIYYFLTPGNPKGVFHRNKARTVHTLHRGRGRYVIIHADHVRGGGKARVETFVVGQNVLVGEKLQWIVEGGKYKASFVLPDTEGGKESEGLLISETVVPGFEFSDHDFLPAASLQELVSAKQHDELHWLVREVD